ncbi:MAG: hypothetical protein KDC53_17585, partial [Saprospiraceae bacterium]|nr:hypothetical protein [Saprospiraceae bacterium]
DVSISVLTDTVYAKNKWYTINDYDVTSDSWSQTRVESDKMGRIKIKTNGGNHHIGIHQETEEANLVLLASTVQNSAWATSGKEVILSLYLLNKGMGKSGPLKIKASAISTSVVFSQDETSCPAIDGLHRQICSTPIIFTVNDDDVDAIRLGVEINDEKNSWSDYLTVPIKPDVEKIEHFMIADGAMYAVARGGNRVDTVTVGRGNGDGIPNPGETIAILVMDQDHYRQTSLASGNPCFYKQGFNGRISDSWEHFDYVGASNKYSMLTLAADCDWSESIPLFLEYWLPDGRPNHIIKRAKITIAVKGRDETAPEEKWVSVTGTNLLQAKIQDGSGIKKVTGFFQGKNEKSFEVQLNDDGKNEDRIASDGVFTVLCPPQLFGFYQLTLTMEDEFGNKSTSEIQKPFLLHH